MSEKTSSDKGNSRTTISSDGDSLYMNSGGESLTIYSMRDGSGRIGIGQGLKPKWAGGHGYYIMDREEQDALLGFLLGQVEE